MTEQRFAFLASSAGAIRAGDCTGHVAQHRINMASYDSSYKVLVSEVCMSALVAGLACWG